MDENDKIKLNQEIVLSVEKFDMDFNTANVTFATINALYSENPIDELQKAKILIDRRIKVLENQIKEGSYQSKKWRGGLSG